MLSQPAVLCPFKEKTEREHRNTKGKPKEAEVTQTFQYWSQNNMADGPVIIPTEGSPNWEQREISAHPNLHDITPKGTTPEPGTEKTKVVVIAFFTYLQGHDV